MWGSAKWPSGPKSAIAWQVKNRFFPKSWFWTFLIVHCTRLARKVWKWYQTKLRHFLSLERSSDGLEPFPAISGHLKRQGGLKNANFDPKIVEISNMRLQFFMGARWVPNFFSKQNSGTLWVFQILICQAFDAYCELWGPTKRKSVFLKNAQFSVVGKKSLFFLRFRFSRLIMILDRFRNVLR